MCNAAAVLMVAISLLGISGCERYALDRQMEELCKKDGGIKVYETVTLPASEFGPAGEPFFRYRGTGSTRDGVFGPDYLYTSRRDVLAGESAKPAHGDEQLIRLHWTIQRRADGKILGEQIEYRRYGGDFVTFGFQPSSASCPHVGRDVEQIVFVKGS